jgi:AsmA protein
MTFGATRALMTVENSRAVFDLRELRGYDGLLTGQFVANNRGGLSVRANLSFSDLALRPLLTDAMGIDRFSGPADGSVNLLGSGSSIAAIMASLSGDGSLRAGPGRIEGIDLEAALGGNASGGTTIFDTGTATFRVDAGVLRNDDLALILPRLRARGEGRIDLGAQRLDYLFTVLDPQARGGRGLAIPVRLKGAWQAVSIRVDAGELIDQNLAEERDKLEQQARDKVNEAIEDRLGVKVEEGQSVEDALKQELEKRAVDGILDLLKR